MAAKLDDQKCPRCQVNPTYPLEKNLGPLSRVARDEGAEVIVCPDCGEREAHRALAGWEPISFADWPLSIDELLREDRLRYEFARDARFQRQGGEGED